MVSSNADAYDRLPTTHVGIKAIILVNPERSDVCVHDLSSVACDAKTKVVRSLGNYIQECAFRINTLIYGTCPVTLIKNPRLRVIPFSSPKEGMAASFSSLDKFRPR